MLPKVTIGTQYVIKSMAGFIKCENICVVAAVTTKAKGHIGRQTWIEGLYQGARVIVSTLVGNARDEGLIPALYSKVAILSTLMTI